MRVGLVGLGTMGGRIAAQLAAGGEDLVVWDAEPDLVDGVYAESPETITAADSPSAVAISADVVLLSLPAPPEVAQVVTGDAGLLAVEAPRAICDLSTVDPDTTRALAARAGEAGAAYLDAPVLGRPPGCGSWTLPVGGSAQAVETVRPVLSHLANRIVHVGDVGSGNALKLVNNLMLGAINGITVECLTMADRAGLDPQVLYDTIAESGAASVSNLFLEIGPKITAGDTSPQFTLDLLAKDNELALAMGRSVEMPLVVGGAVQTLNQLGRDRGLGGLDTSALTRLYASQEEER